MNKRQDLKTITEDFDKLLLYNIAVRNSMDLHRMGILSEVDALKLSIITLAQQIEVLQDEVSKLLFARRGVGDTGRKSG